MIVIGLTGGIGTGKSTASAMLRRMGLPVHDADAEVHRLLGRGGAAVAAVAAAFPGAEKNGAIDRQALGARVFADRAALRRLEALLHPLVRRVERRFIARQRARHAPAVVLDIPLLFETGSDKRCDAVIVMTAPRYLQRARVLARPGMSAEKLRAILARQMPEAEKRRRADRLVPSSLGRAVTWRGLKQALRGLGLRTP